MSLSSAREGLNEYSPKPNGSSIVQNLMHSPFQYNLQIIIPAYNVEAFLEECMASVLSQKTEYSFLVVLIDDGSTDKTPMMADFYKNVNNVKIVHQINKGFSGARNTGLHDIYAEYIMFVDSDDMLMAGAIQALMDTAKKKNADIVCGGFNDLYDGQLTARVRFDDLCEVNAEEKMGGAPWAKIFRSELFQNICFPEGFWFEDTIISFLICPYAKRAFFIPDVVYTYRMNPLSITHIAIYQKKSVDTVWVTELILREHKKLNLGSTGLYYNKMMRQIILNYKRMKKLPKEIQESAFVVTSQLFCNYLEKISCRGQYDDLARALKNDNFGLYRLYCKTH